MYTPRVHSFGTIFALGLGLFVLGCSTYKQPQSAEPHAVVVGTFFGGELNRETGFIAFGYSPGVRVCKGEKANERCKKFIEGNFDKRDLVFRVEVGEELTISPFALTDYKYENNGVTQTQTTSYCFADSLTITPKAGDKYFFGYKFAPKLQGCGTVWKTDGTGFEEGNPSEGSEPPAN